MKRTLFRQMNQTAIQVFFSALLFVTMTQGAEICDWTINTCPENLDGQTIFVPPTAVALSSNIYSCDVANVFEGVYVSSGTPALMFVVDNSLSMIQGGGGGAGSSGNDREGTRYVVTRDLLDSIYAVQPQARVGLAVFREVLYFDQRTHEILEPLTGVAVTNEQYTNQAFLPPLQLNGSYDFNGTPTPGIDIIKFFLNTEQDRDGAVVLEYTPQFSTTGYTNINNGFAAALQGLSQIPVSEIPPEQRFIVFLSDGVPQNPNDDIPDSMYHGGKDPYFFQAGLNTPTTFTVFLNDGGAAPENMETMTENIRNNGYSTSNPSSELWSLRTNYTALMSLFMENILQPILSIQSGYPTFMSVNSVTSTVRSDSSFVFSNRFALERDTTAFNINITYHLTDQTTGRVFDSTTYSNFTVIRRSGQQLTEGDLLCRDRDIQLYFNGSPVSAVNASMSDLQVVFSSSDASYSSVSVIVTTSGQTDNINLPLNPNASGFTGDFTREIADAVPGDLRLQHGTADSIVLIYRNPQVPLDTIRKAYPFSGKLITVVSAAYYDRNADGFVDSIFTGISGEITAGDLSSLRNLVQLPSYRNFRVDSAVIRDGGIAWYVTDGNTSIKTTVGPEDIVRVTDAILPGGNLVAAGTVPVRDRIAPVLISAELIITGAGDSVKVVFSEQVNQFNSARPLNFSKNGTVYQVSLEQAGVLAGTQYTSRVSTVQTGFGIEANDLVWINPAAMISDTAANAQTNAANRQVPITVKEMPITIITRVVNNPFRPTDPVPDPVRNAYIQNGRVPPSSGLTIVVEPRGEIIRNVNISGTVSIYDVVKNTVIKDVPGVYDTENQKFYFAWDGLNSNGRKVSTGTYTAVVKVEDAGKNLKDSRILYLGVRR